MSQIDIIEELKVKPPVVNMDDLASVFSAYNEITNRMHRSHLQLKGEVIRLRKELKHKNELLERKSRLAALGEMAAGMAHEIRNPLGGIQLYVSLLAKELQGQAESLLWTDKITKGVHTLDTIVNDILAFTQDQVCQKTEVNLSALLMEVMDYVRPQVKAKEVTVDFGTIDRNLVVDIDLNMMSRILMNLILNAIGMMEEGGRVDISAGNYDRDEQYRFYVCVSDTGPGIDPAVMDKIFNPFFTTRDSGTGLGLAIVHRLVECHGGAITATNKDTGGAMFTILLP